jgi:hypothetical protein
MRPILVAAPAAIASACLLAAGAAGGAPPGATARCRDGTFSYSQHRSGTCSHHHGVEQWLGTAAAGDAPAAQGAAKAPAVSLGATVVLARPTASTHCRRGPLPDRRCSPGAYSAGLTTQILCSRSFRTATIRDVPQSEKVAVLRAYGMPVMRYGRTIEIDHIVSLELGGSNAIANLSPEQGSGAESYHVKDRLENRLHTLVCTGRMTLRSAQRQIARNWIALYRRVFGVPAFASG